MSIDKLFFTIVIPVYNKGPHINRSISSVVNQTFQNFELLLINDASTDTSLEKMQKFTDPRIRILHREQPGPGGYAARNLGIKEANADWVAFLDADDEWMPEHLANYITLIRHHPDVSVLGCGCEFQDPDYHHVKSFLDPYYVKNYYKGSHLLFFAEYLISEVSGMRPLNGSTACIKREILLDVGGFPESIAKRGGDVDTWLRCIENAGSIFWSSHKGAIYYRNAVNMVTRTQLFLAECERDTVRNLLPKYSGGVCNLLKRFSNQRTIDAWRRNTHITNKCNIYLPGKLYVGVEPIKCLVWFVISLLPQCFYLMIENLVRNSKAVSHFRNAVKAISMLFT